MLKLFKKLFTKKKKINTERIIHYGNCCEKDFDPIPKEKPNFNPPPQKPIPPKPQVLKEGFVFKIENNDNEEFNKIYEKSLSNIIIIAGCNPSILENSTKTIDTSTTPSGVMQIDEKKRRRNNN